MTRQEAASLLRAARKLDDRDSGRALARFIILGIYTGSRSGVIRRLGWLPNTIGGWIDLTSGVIHRRADGETETKKRRPPVRIPGRMIGFLRRWRAEDMRQSEDHKPIPFVIHYRGKPVDKQRKAWAEACRVAGLGNDVMPHILRHTAVTWMMQAGNDPWDVSGYVGMSLKMLEDVYGHHHPDHQKGIAGRIGRK
ncbi:site-specific integrase [Consotaella salsifontis]|nr:site-specific integrase [Consotaella salsifontis]